MKKFKKIMALAIAMVMVLAMSVTAFADGETTKYSITITAPAGHTYQVFQVFTGTPENGQLTGLKYGANAKGNTGAAVSSTDLAALKTISGKTYNNDQEKIADLEQYVDMNNPVAEVASETATVGLAPGFYVIKDTAGPVDEGLSLYMFQVLDKNLTISAKSDKPSSVKKVQDKNDTTDTALTGLQDSADYEIGDTIPYTLTFTLPSDYANFKKYYVQFYDTMDAGLTYNGNAKIYYGASDTTGTDISAAFGTVGTAGATLKYTINDLKTGTDAQKALQAGDVIKITYEAYLNDAAKTEYDGNKNTYYVNFSRNPNESGDGKPETGKTPDDVNVVFTYKTVFEKVDEDGNELLGADFTLYKKMKDGSKVEVTTLGGLGGKHPIKTSSATSNQFTFKGLDDGTYVLEETKVPDGYNQMPDLEFTITAGHQIEADNPILETLTGTDGAEFTFSKIDVSHGTLTTSITNKSGAVLPSTGGVGTTMFYIVGAILAVGAGILLVTRRRMDAQ